MKNLVTKCALIGFVILLIPLTSYSQSERLIDILDSLVENEFNYVLDTNLTDETKPDPLIIVDGYIITKEKFIENFKLEDIKSFSTFSDSSAFKIFDRNAWGGLIMIVTNLTKRKLKKKL